MKTIHTDLLPAGLCRTLPCLAMLLLLAAAPQARAEFTFSNTADRTSPLFNDFGIPSINSSGTLGFLASLETKRRGESRLGVCC